MDDFVLSLGEAHIGVVPVSPATSLADEVDGASMPAER